MINFAVKRPISVLMIGVAILVLGAISLKKIALNFMPVIKSQDFQILISAKGTSAEEIEKNIIDPIEKSISTTPGILSVNSVSKKDFGKVFIHFRADIELVETLSVLRERVDMVSMPEGVSKPRIQRDQRGNQPILRLVLQPTDRTKNPVLWLEEIKSTLGRSLERVKGVASVQFVGTTERFIQIQMDPRKMRALNIQPQSIVDIIQGSNRFLSMGEIKTENQMTPILVGSEFGSLEEIQKLSLKREGNRNVQISDVADLSISEEKTQAEVNANGKPGLILEVVREPEANAVLVAKQAVEILKLAAEVEKNFEFSFISNQGEEIQAAIDNVFESVITGSLLAGLVIFLLVQSGWPTFVINIAIPLSLLTTFVLMYFTGISFNLMSLAGLALGVGMLVDNSTVVLSSISQEGQTNSDPSSTAIQGTKKVAHAVISSTLSTIAVFGPLAFVPGVIGQMFRDLAATVCYSILSSLLMALLFIPMLSAHQKRFTFSLGQGLELGFVGQALQRKSKRWNEIFSAWLQKQVFVFHFWKGLGADILRALGSPCQSLIDPVFAVTNRIFGVLEEKLKNGIHLAFVRRRAFLLGSALSIGVGLLGLSFLGSELFPEDPTDLVAYELSFTPGTTSEVRKRASQGIESNIEKLSFVKNITAVVGVAPGSLTKFFIQLKSIAKPYQLEEMSQWIGKHPSVSSHRIKTSMVSEEKPIRIEFVSEDLEKLGRALEWAQKAITGIDGIMDLRSSQEALSSEVQIEFQRARLAQFGADANQFVTPIKAYLKGLDGGSLQIQGKNLSIHLNKPQALLNTIDEIKFYSVPGVDDLPIYLNEVARIDEVQKPSSIYRSEKKRIGFIEAEFSGGDLGKVNQQIRDLLGSQFPYRGVEWRMAGQELQRKANNANLLIAIGLSILLIFLLLASQFESLSQPLVVLSSVPFCLLGMAIFLWLFQLQISVLVFVGFIILVGSSVNTSIVMVDYANQLVLEGLSAKDAIVKAAQKRMRSILVTTLSNVFGLMPMAMSAEAKGSGMQRPLSVTILGGLMSSTLLTLIIVPLLFVIAAKWSETKEKLKNNVPVDVK